MSRGFSFSISCLKVLIQEHHELFISLMGETLTPKMHILTLTRELLNKVAQFLICRPFEIKPNIEILRKLLQLMSRLNIAHSLAVKHQMSICHQFLLKEGLIPDMQTGPGHIITLHDMLLFIQALPLELRDTDCMTFKWIDYKGTTYKLGMVVVIGAQDLCPLFGEVVTIIVNGHDVCPLLVCTVLLNVRLSERACVCV